MLNLGGEEEAGVVGKCEETMVLLGAGVLAVTEWEAETEDEAAVVRLLDFGICSGDGYGVMGRRREV